MPVTKISLAGLGRLLRSIPRQLASIKLGLLLLVFIFVFSLAAAFTPARQFNGVIQGIGRFLALDNVARVGVLDFQDRFESPGFILLTVVLGLSLCFSLYFRLRGELKRLRAQAARPPADEAVQEQSGLPKSTIDSVRQELKQRGYRTELVFETGMLKVHGARGGSGVWGSLLFHASMLLIFAAVVLSAFASFSASVKLTEGQAFDARVDRYGVQKAGRWYSPPPEPLTFSLMQVDPEYEVNGEMTTATIIQPTTGAKATRFTPHVPLYTGNGLRHAGMTIHQGKETGFAPLIVVWDAQGKRLIAGYIRLATSRTFSKQEVYRDLVEVPGKNIRAEFELLPDAVYRDGAYSSISDALRSPILHVVLLEHGKVVLDKFIIANESALGAGYTVHFGGVRRWSQLDISDDPAPPLLLAGTLTGFLGLALRLLCVRRRVVVSLRRVNQTIEFDLSGASEKFPRTFEEELATLRIALSRLLATPATAAPEITPAQHMVAGRASGSIA